MISSVPPTPSVAEDRQPPVVGKDAVGSDLETVIGVVPVARKTGFLSQEVVHIIVTERRLVFAVLTNEMLRQAGKESVAEKGFLSGLLGSLTLGYTYHQRYLSMPPETALQENPQNFAILKHDIVKVKLERGRSRAVPHRTKKIFEPGRLEIESHRGRLVFSVVDEFYDLANTTLRQSGYPAYE